MHLARGESLEAERTAEAAEGVEAGQEVEGHRGAIPERGVFQGGPGEARGDAPRIMVCYPARLRNRADPRMTDDWPRDEPLTLDGVHARRGGVEVLRGISLEFPPGSRTVVIGRSGSGKSTLLRLLNRLAEPSAGVIRVGSRPIASFPVTWLRRKVGLVFQAPRPLPGQVIDNLAYPRSVGAAHRSEAEGRWAVPMLQEVGLDPSWLDRDAAGLSGGERQRLALAVALQTDPAILALDEPTSALDPESARRVIDVLRDRSERDGLTTIAVTHNREQAPWLGDRAVVLDAGRVVDQGPTAEVLDRANGSFWAGSEAP